MRAARNKYAFGFCDRTGFRYPLNELVDEYRNGVKTGLRVGRDVADDDHPQNFLGRIRIFDPQSLSSARPDRSLAESRSLFGFDPVWNPAQYLITSVGKVTVTTGEVTHPQTGLQGTTAVGSATASIPKSFNVTGASSSPSVGSVTILTATGVAAPAATGGVGVVNISNVDSTLQITGVGATTAVGSVAVNAPIQVAGSGATASVGTATATGTNSLTASGSGATASVGAVTVSTPSVTTYTVTVASGSNYYGSGNKYYIGGSVSPTLTLNEGSTYRFDQSDGSNSTHPLRFSTTANGTHGGGSAYTTGVTTSGTAGSSGAYVEITVASGAPTLYYYCVNHSGMGGQANTP